MSLQEFYFSEEFEGTVIWKKSHNQVRNGVKRLTDALLADFEGSLVHKLNKLCECATWRNHARAIYRCLLYRVYFTKIYVINPDESHEYIVNRLYELYIKLLQSQNSKDATNAANATERAAFIDEKDKEEEDYIEGKDHLVSNDVFVSSENQSCPVIEIWQRLMDMRINVAERNMSHICEYFGLYHYLLFRLCHGTLTSCFMAVLDKKSSHYRKHLEAFKRISCKNVCSRQELDFAVELSLRNIPYHDDSQRVENIFEPIFEYFEDSSFLMKYVSFIMAETSSEEELDISIFRGFLGMVGTIEGLQSFLPIFSDQVKALPPNKTWKVLVFARLLLICRAEFTDSVWRDATNLLEKSVLFDAFMSVTDYFMWACSNIQDLFFPDIPCKKFPLGSVIFFECGPFPDKMIVFCMLKCFERHVKPLSCTLWYKIHSHLKLELNRASNVSKVKREEYEKIKETLTQIMSTN